MYAAAGHPSDLQSQQLWGETLHCLGPGEVCRHGSGQAGDIVSSWRHCVILAVEQFTWKCSLHVTLWLLKANGRASQTHCSSDASHSSDNFSAFFLFPKGKPDAWQCSHAGQHRLRALSAPDWACTHLEEPPLDSSAPRPQRALVS